MKNKRKKVERIWLISVIFFYVCYNLPMIPGYGQQFPMLLHSLLTLVPLWISVYAGLICVCRMYPLRKKKEDTEKEND